MKKLFILFVLLNSYTFAQPLKLDMKVFADRRETFKEKMEPNSVAIFPSKPVYLRNLDVEYVFRQESNFYYLSGFEEPESILLINPNHPNYKYVMFVRKRDRRRETYDGPRAGVEGAISIFEADTALYINDFGHSVSSFIKYDRPIYYTFGINPQMDDKMTKMFVEQRSGCDWPIIDPAPILAEMRLIKTDSDLQMGLQKAIDISALAHIEAIKSIEPRMYEYEIQAVFEYIFRKNGSPRNGYPCIVGSGPNSTILHYSKNNRQMKNGEVLLVDCGAEYGYYSADITRTVPVNGKFSRAQREIYQLVFEAQNTAMRMVKPGVEKSKLDRVIDNVLGEGLVKLGLIKNKKDFRIFSLHGYAHWIGLEVHDVGRYTQNGESITLKPGMVFTIEPGIYVRPDVFDKMQERGYTEDDLAKIRPKVEKYMNIGVRIEDDILVTETGYKNLSATVPREIWELEKLMKKKGIGNLLLSDSIGK